MSIHPEDYGDHPPIRCAHCFDSGMVAVVAVTPTNAMTFRSAEWCHCAAGRRAAANEHEAPGDWKGGIES